MTFRKPAWQQARLVEPDERLPGLLWVRLGPPQAVRYVRIGSRWVRPTEPYYQTNYVSEQSGTRVLVAASAVELLPEFKVRARNKLVHYQARVATASTKKLSLNDKKLTLRERAA